MSTTNQGRGGWRPCSEIDPEPHDIASGQGQDPTTRRCSERRQGEHRRGQGGRGLPDSYARAAHDNAARDADARSGSIRSDPGAISVRRPEMAQASRETARSRVAAAEADVRHAIEGRRASGDDNSQLFSARLGGAQHWPSWIARTPRVVAPGRGLITGLEHGCRPVYRGRRPQL